jgi:tetratricopeptide (TPR) repeat protein
MAESALPRPAAVKEFIMRYAPLAIALSLGFAVTSSMGMAGEREPAPRAAMLIAEGQAALDAGQPQKAIDSFEAALAVDPAYTGTYLHLAEAARREGLQGKAIRYYREVLDRDPDNYAAISGEGEALVEKGAIEKARTNLAKLESECGSSCAETQDLANAIARGPQPRVLAAENVLPDTQVTQN